jgi:hypothetical protein
MLVWCCGPPVTFGYSTTTMTSPLLRQAHGPYLSGSGLRKAAHRPVSRPRCARANATIWVRRDAPVRALSASASRTTSVVRPADQRTLMERRGVCFRATDGSTDYREARRRLDAGGERADHEVGSPASLAPGRESLMRVGGTPRELSTVYSQWSSGSAARQALRTERWRRQRDP